MSGHDQPVKRDGRRARGEERRRRLTTAALAVLERDGLSGLTHRAVAAEAGVPLASATYHFDSIDDLALSTILQATEDFVRSVDRRSDRGTLSGYAAALADELSRNRGRVIAGYELYLLAARRPTLRDAATTWLRAGAEPFLADADPVQRRAFLAACNSMCLEALLAERPPTADEIEGLLRHVLGEDPLVESARPGGP